MTDEPVFQLDLGHRLAFLPRAHDIVPRDPTLAKAPAFGRKPRIAIAKPIDARLENLYPVVIRAFPLTEPAPHLAEEPAIVGHIDCVGVERKNLSVEALADGRIDRRPGRRCNQSGISNLMVTPVLGNHPHPQ